MLSSSWTKCRDHTGTFIYDVFTSALFGGNQLAVFLDGRGLSTVDMQAIAKEMNFSESTFILPPESEDTDMRVRIFTPGEELPMAGHPTIGTAFALARAGVLRPARQRVVFGLGVGPTPVDLTWRRHGTGVRLDDATASRPSVRRSTCGACSRRRAPAAGRGDRQHRLPVQIVSCGVPYLIVPLAVARRGGCGPPRGFCLRKARRVKAVSDRIAIYLFTTERARGDSATVYSRMFAPVHRNRRRSGDRQRGRPARLLPRRALCHRFGKRGYDNEPARGPYGTPQCHPYGDCQRRPGDYPRAGWWRGGAGG